MIHAVSPALQLHATLEAQTNRLIMAHVTVTPPADFNGIDVGNRGALWPEIELLRMFDQKVSERDYEPANLIAISSITFSGDDRVIPPRRTLQAVEIQVLPGGITNRIAAELPSFVHVESGSPTITVSTNNPGRGHVLGQDNLELRVTRDLVKPGSASQLEEGQLAVVSPGTAYSIENNSAYDAEVTVLEVVIPMEQGPEILGTTPAQSLPQQFDTTNFPSNSCLRLSLLTIGPDSSVGLDANTVVAVALSLGEQAHVIEPGGILPTAHSLGAPERKDPQSNPEQKSAALWLLAVLPVC